MHLPPSFDSSIITSPLHRRSSYRASDTSDTMLSYSSARTEKITPPPSPLQRTRTPFRYKKRSRTLGRVAILLVVCIMVGVGLGGREWICGEHKCAGWFESNARDQGDFVGGGSVIGNWKEETGSQNAMGSQDSGGVDFGLMDGAEPIIVDSGDAVQQDEPPHTHVEPTQDDVVQAVNETNERNASGDGGGAAAAPGGEMPIVGTMDMGAYKA